MRKLIKPFFLLTLAINIVFMTGGPALPGSLKTDIEGLRRQVQDLNRRLRAVESQTGRIKGVIKQARAAVVYLWGTYTFVDSEGRPLRYFLNNEGKPIADPKGTPKVDVTGTGPVAVTNYCGTAFLVDRNGGLLTNRHVVEPWWGDEKDTPLLKAGLRPVFLRLRAFFQEKSEGVPIEIIRIHPEEDLAYIRTVHWRPKAAPLTLFPASKTVEEGQPVILMGFPTGLEAVLAKLDDSEYDEIQKESGLCTYETAQRLSQKKKILPSTTGGMLWEVLPKSLVYDARTKEGGSGGPLLNYQGQVVGVNVSYLPGFSGGNFAVPIRFGIELIEGKGAPSKEPTREDPKLSGWLEQGKVPVTSCSE
jgi:S1-C subfamily serine protease